VENASHTQKGFTTNVTTRGILLTRIKCGSRQTARGRVDALAFRDKLDKSSQCTGGTLTVWITTRALSRLSLQRELQMTHRQLPSRMVHAVYTSGNLLCLRILVFSELIIRVFALDILTLSHYHRVLGNTPNPRETSSFQQLSSIYH